MPQRPGMKEILIDSGQLIGELRVQILDDFGIGFHDVSPDGATASWVALPVRVSYRRGGRHLLHARLDGAEDHANAGAAIGPFAAAGIDLAGAAGATANGFRDITIGQPVAGADDHDPIPWQTRADY